MDELSHRLSDCRITVENVIKGWAFLNRMLSPCAVGIIAILVASIGHLTAQSNFVPTPCEEAWHNQFSYLPSRVERAGCSSCEQRSDLAGECFDVRARLNFYNGNPTFRLWMVGTNRILGLVPDEYPIAPQELMNQIDMGVVVYGDFRVCPFTEDRPGYMRYVCVESVKNVLVQDRRIKGMKGRYFKGPWSLPGERPKESSK